MVETLHNNCFELTPRLEELSELRYFIESYCTDNQLNNSISNKLILAVDEACTNIIRYNNLNNNVIVFEIRLVNDYLEAVIKDKGNSFDLTNYATPNMEEYLNTMKNGGLGIHLIKSLTNSVKYESKTQLNPYNQLTLSLKVR